MDCKVLLTPLNIIIAASAAGLAVLIYIVFFFIKRRNFRLRLLLLRENPELMKTDFARFFKPGILRSRSDLIEKTALKNGLELLSLSGTDNFWLEELKKRKGGKLFRRVLNYNPGKGLFTCFLIALENKKYSSLFLRWLKENDDFLLLRRLALSGVGEEFDGRKALTFFEDYLPRIREMTGDPEWASRYFAIKVLLYDDTDQSQRSVWESIHDPHPLVRKTICREFSAENKEKLYNELFRLYLNDPVLEVRAEAKERINRDYSDIYSINIDNLDPPKALHALEHLNPHSKTDEDTAMRFLDHDNLELRFSAARFLEDRGALQKLLEQADMGDREDLERRKRLLTKSCEVHITSFLHRAASSNNPASLLIAAEILGTTGDISLIAPVASKIFDLPLTVKDNREIFDSALNCINRRGGDKAFSILLDQLQKHSSDVDYSGKILNALPSEGASFFLPRLLSLLEDTSFSPREELREAIIRMPQYLYIRNLLTIIQSGRGKYSHTVRKDALKILISLKQSFCLQTVLENLPILPVGEAREFAKLLVQYDREEFNTLSAMIFESDDASVRSSLISCLPALEAKNFLKNIREALGDADPDVRIAAIWALVDFGETKTVSQAVDMLRDPVPRVRSEAARAIGGIGSENAMNSLREILSDINEVASVKNPALEGLSRSEHLLSIDIMTDFLVQTDEYDTQVIKSLAAKTAKREISRMIEIFKDGSPSLRDKLSEVFSSMKEQGEEMLLDLLKEDITALKPFICQILDKTGFIESRIRLLKHRKPEIRRDAALQLSFIGTASAFRGIVLAARDSDKEVRVAVTKALEKLNNSEGTEILKTLREDPDRKVRKYTDWALERLTARNME